MGNAFDKIAAGLDDAIAHAQGEPDRAYVATRQFVVIRFYPEGMAYTYHNDGPPVCVGDRVNIAGRKSEKPKAVTVEAVTHEAPKFATKPILGVVGDASHVVSPGDEWEGSGLAPNDPKPAKPGDLFGRLL